MSDVGINLTYVERQDIHIALGMYLTRLRKDYKNDPTCGGKCKKSNGKMIAIIIIITLITIILSSIGVYFLKKK